MGHDFDIIKVNLKDKDRVLIVPLGDVHYGAVEHNNAEFTAFVNEIAGRDDVYVVLMGDLINNSIRTSVANPFDETARPDFQVEYMINQLYPIRKKIIGSVAGNHEYRTKKNVDIDINRTIMRELGREEYHRSNMAYMQIELGRQPREDGKKSKVPKQKWLIGATHGVIGGTIGNCVNKAEGFWYTHANLDALLKGHSHKAFITRPARIAEEGGYMYTEPGVCIVTESWQEYGDYALRFNLTPAEACFPPHLILDSNYSRIHTFW